VTSTHVFHGPSLTSTQLTALLPEAVSHPPVRHGDLLALPLRPADRVVILDGVFQQAAPVRHKEICVLLAAGVGVWGAASMGALRAAELHQVGMVGAGIVFRLYTSGLLERDDEVALVHTEPDRGSRALTVALVSVRVLARRLRHAGALDIHSEGQLVGAADELHFTERSWPHLLDRAALPPSVRCAVEAAIAEAPLMWDVKVRDAARLLRHLGGATSTPSAPGDDHAGHAALVETSHLERWRRRARPEDDRLVTAAALYGADYPDLHRRVVLALLGGTADPARAALHADDATLAAAAVHTADRHQLFAPLSSSPTQHLLRLVRGYSWGGGLAPTPVLAAAIRATPGVAALEQLIVSADHLNQSLASRGHHAGHSSPTALRRHLRPRWGLPDEPAVAEWRAAQADRGFHDDEDLHDRAAWFTPQLVLSQPAPVTLRPHLASPVNGDGSQRVRSMTTPGTPEDTPARQQATERRVSADPETT